MASDLITVDQEVQTGLHQLDETQLLLVAKKLDISSQDEEKVRGRGRRGVLRWVGRCLGREEVEDMEDGGLSILQGVLSIMEDLVESTSKKEEDIAPGTDEDGTTPKEERIPSPTQATSHDQVPLSVLATLMRRDFKVSGQIGEPGQKDKVSFTSLMRQLDAGKDKGYAERELVEGVIKAISPGMRLRSYLESKEKLTLSTLKEILEVHFREGDATALYKELSSASQGSTESCQDFVMRTLDLRQKIVQASRRVDASLRYDSELVQKMFLHSMSTGISNDNVRMEVRLLLQDPDVSDETLLKCVKDADDRENERRGKQKRVKVSQIKENDNDLTATIKQLQADLAALKANQEAPPSQQPPPRGPPRERGPGWGCMACRNAGMGPECRHCFHCGSSNHFLRGCRLRDRPQENLLGNAQGSPRRDRGWPQGPSPSRSPQDQ